MLKARMDYGAISAKVLALYGRLLKAEDWQRLCESAAPADVLAFLKTQPGWSAYVAELSSASDAASLKKAIRGKQHHEREKLYRFCSLDDKALLRVLSCGAEYSYILAALRCLYSGESVRLPEETTDFMRRSSRVNTEALQNAASFSAIRDAAAESVFASALSELVPDGKTGLPDYSQAGVTLERCYYRYVFSSITKKYSGTGKAELIRLLGTQADLLNIVGILRLHRYFPDSLQSAQELLVPVCGKLKPKLVASLLAARSEMDAVEQLRSSPFAEYFLAYRPEELDRLYEKAMNSFCRKIIKMPAPNICVPVAYLTLSELECDKLIRIIEALGYGIKPEEF